jgi:hypothetical protein
MTISKSAQIQSGHRNGEQITPHGIKHHSNGSQLPFFAGLFIDSSILISQNSDGSC